MSKIPKSSNQIRAEKFSQAYSPSKKQSEPKMRQLSNKPQDWNSDVKTVGYFDPNMAKKSKLNTEKRQIQKQKNQNQTEYDEKIYEELTKQPVDRAQDPRTQAARKINSAKIQTKREYESYHTLAQIQELVDQENARKNANVLRKHEKELQQLRWMLNQEEKSKEEGDKIFNERYQQLKEQKEINLEMQKKLIQVKQSKATNIQKKAVEFEQRHKKSYLNEQEEDHPPAEYIEGMMWEKEATGVPQQKQMEEFNTFGQQPQKKQDQRRQSEIQSSQKRNQSMSVQVQQQQKPPEQPKQTRQQTFDQSAEKVEDLLPTKEDGTQDKQKILQRKQSQMNDGLKLQLIEIQREQAKKAREVEELLQLHKAQMQKDKDSENQPFQLIENRLNKIKGIVEPLDQKLRQQLDRDFAQGNILVKTSSKMIQTYNEKITDLIIDDMLYELVHTMQQLEEKKKFMMKQDKREAVITDYVQEFKELAIEQDEIEERLRSITYKPIDFFDGIRPGARDYVQDSTFAKVIQLELSRYIMLQIIEKRNAFTEGLNKKSHYSKRNLESFKIITDELIDDIIYEVTVEVDKANDEYAEVLFKNEFQ